MVLAYISVKTLWISLEKPYALFQQKSSYCAPNCEEIPLSYAVWKSNPSILCYFYNSLQTHQLVTLQVSKLEISLTYNPYEMFELWEHVKRVIFL